MDCPTFLTTVDTAFDPSVTGSTPSYSASSAGGSTSYLDAGNPATLRVVTTDTFIFCGWLKIATGKSGIILTKGDANAGTAEYTIDASLVGANNFIRARVATNALGGVGTVTADGEISSNVKQFIVVWSDTTSINIRIHAGSTHSTVIARLTNPVAGGTFRVFQDSGATDSALTGILDEWFFCKNPPDLATALTLINGTIYNSATGTRYSGITAANKTTLGLVSWWGFDESSTSNRKDLYGSNDLTLNGTISQTTAIVI